MTLHIVSVPLSVLMSDGMLNVVRPPVTGGGPLELDYIESHLYFEDTSASILSSRFGRDIVSQCVCDTPHAQTCRRVI